MTRAVLVFAVAVLVVATFWTDVSADDCKDCSIRTCDVPCDVQKGGSKHACDQCHTIDVPKICGGGCRGKRDVPRTVGQRVANKN
ncbi:hypothetical protein AAVH_14037 [Aphelenchoides avenae]|nr:hypothetical protein AAVH_14037 [Aphelenchus avenae]